MTTAAPSFAGSYRFSCLAALLLQFAAAHGQQPAQAHPSATKPRPPVVQDSSEQIADRIVKSKKPVLVDFWAPWCGPCKQLNPMLKELEKEYTGKVLFLRVNVDQHVVLARYFQVSAIPAVFIIKDKTVVSALPGLRYVGAYREALNAVLAAPAPGRDSASVKPASEK